MFGYSLLKQIDHLHSVLYSLPLEPLEAFSQHIQSSLGCNNLLLWCL